jgi:hypothetical protein
MRQHYHVIENTPGYLPEDDEPFATYSRKQANAVALDLARDLRANGYRVSGSAKSGGYYGTTNEKMYDLGRVIEVIPCTESDCAPNAE